MDLGLIYLLDNLISKWRCGSSDTSKAAEFPTVPMLCPFSTFLAALPNNIIIVSPLFCFFGNIYLYTYKICHTRILPYYVNSVKQLFNNYFMLPFGKGTVPN